MKKTFLFLSGLLLLASCSNSDDVTSEVSVPALGGSEEIAPLSTEPIYGVPVKLGLGSTVNVTPSTKGTGTVGGIGTEENKWYYENLYILMTTEGEGLVMEDGKVKVERLPSMDEKTDPKTGAPNNEPMEADRKDAGWGYVYVQPDGNQYDGKFISRPKDRSNVSELVNFNKDFSQGENSAVKYYPPQATCQFYGFHIDDAATNKDANGNPILTFDDVNGQITTLFEINGTQDLMTGMATEYMDVYKTPGDPSSGYKYPFFAAAVARHPSHAKQPKIKMQHQSVRFTFEARPGNVTNVNDVTIETIEMESFTQGTLVAACRDITKTPYLDWNDEDWNTAKYLKLEGASTASRTLDGAVDQGGVNAFEPEDIKFDGSAGKVFPGALFVCPTARHDAVNNQNFYNMKVTVSEKINGVPQKQTLDIKVIMPDTEDYTGRSYNVVFYVYPHEVVVAQVELQAWKTGADLPEFNLDPALE